MGGGGLGWEGTTEEVKIMDWAGISFPTSHRAAAVIQNGDRIFSILSVVDQHLTWLRD